MRIDAGSLQWRLSAAAAKPAHASTGPDPAKSGQAPCRDDLTNGLSSQYNTMLVPSAKLGNTPSQYKKAGTMSANRETTRQ
jgi:hypothetical protein